MYGFFGLPKGNHSIEDRKKFQTHMCALCTSLHKNYGIKARMLTNFDCTFLSIFSSSLIENKFPYLNNNLYCLNFLKKLEPHIQLISNHIAAISIMLAYSKSMDNIIESGEKGKNDEWLSRKAEKANKYLIEYGLTKGFFEKKIEEQHLLESISNDIFRLSRPTSDILGKIFESVAKLLNLNDKSDLFRELGKEIGKLVYIYDGVVDFKKDYINNSFNCINVCFNNNDKVIEDIPNEVQTHINTIKKNVLNILSSIELGSGSLLISNIIERDIIIENHNLYQNKNDSIYSEKSLYDRVFFGILFSSTFIQIVSGSSEKKDFCVCDCCADFCGSGWNAFWSGLDDPNMWACRCCCCCCCIGMCASSFNN